MKNFLIGFSMIVIGACAAPDLSPSTVELCEQTVRDYAVLRDEGPAETYGDLFTDDGEFHLAGNITKGREALIGRFAAANQALRWRHNMTDIRIVENADGITGKSRFHIFAGPRTETPSPPDREILGHYVDEFVIEDGTCKIKVRRVEIVFDKKT